jgi:hypothetical protein
MARSIDGVPWCEQIENVLFHHVFGWPMLVADVAKPPGQGRSYCCGQIRCPAVALPVMVDVFLDESRNLPGQIEIVGDGAFDRGDVYQGDSAGLSFADHLIRAHRAARHLWLAERSAGEPFSHKVGSSTARFDFGVATEIIRGACPDIKRIVLGGGSASAYLSQLVLARLLGRLGPVSGGVSGMIGEQIRPGYGTYGCDHALEPVGHASDKVLYAFDAHLYGRLVLPAHGTTTTAISELLHDIEQGVDDECSRQTASVVYTKTLAGVADIVQEAPWRRNAYVRCPEVAWAVHGYGRNRDGILPLGDRGVAEVLSRLRANDANLMEFDDVGPRAVASAFCHLERRAQASGRGSTPVLFWQFIRVSEGQSQILDEDAELWHILWRLTGAQAAAFDLFRTCPTREAATRRLADVLSRFEPREDAPAHRAPDVIVLVGTNALRDSYERWEQKLSRPLAPWGILEEMRKRNDLPISPCRQDCHELRDALGRTRVILLAEGVRDDLPPVEKPDASDQDWALLKALSIFRWGFTQAMAAAVLGESGLHGRDVRSRLKDLRQRDLLREFRGEYHIPVILRDQAVAADSKTPAHVRANRHRSAGLAMAPYASEARLPSLLYEDSFRPETALEAYHHLLRAMDLQGEASAQPGHFKTARTRKGDLRRIVHILVRAAMLPGWGLVHRLLKSKLYDAADDASYAANELLEAFRRHPDNPRRQPDDEVGIIPPHPLDFLRAARAAAQRDPVVHPPTQAVAWYEAALAACRFYADPTNFRVYEAEEVNKLQVLPYFANYLATLSDPAAQKRAVELDREIEEIMTKVRLQHRMPGEWFERVGDQALRPEEAAVHYARGIEYAPDWHQLAFKALGAGILAGVDTAPQVQNWLKEMDDNGGACALATRKAHSAAERDIAHAIGGRKSSVVMSYWQAAVKQLVARWPNQSAVRSLAETVAQGNKKLPTARE